MALRPTLNTTSPVRPPPFVPPTIIAPRENIPKSSVLQYPIHLPLPKIPLPTLPDMLLNNMNSVTLPSVTDIQDTIASLSSQASTTQPINTDNQTQSPSSSHSHPSATNNHESKHNTEEEDTTTSSDDEDEDDDIDDDSSTRSSHQDDDEYDYYDDYDQTHKYDESEDDEFESKYRKKHRRKPSTHRRKRKHKTKHHKRRVKTPRKPDPPRQQVNIKPSKGGEGAFRCTKCRRTFSTNRALASHQRAHKNKIPPSTQAQMKALGVAAKVESNPVIEAELDNDIWMRQLNGILPPPIQADIKTQSTFGRNLPNLNTISSIKDLKNMNLTRLAMPTIKGRKRYQINNQNISPHLNDEDYKFHCDKCNAAFFYQQDVVKHKQYSECVERPYLCPFCERPFKSCLSVKKHCVNLHSSIINWDLVGELLDFVGKHEGAAANVNVNREINYAKLVRKFARDYFLFKQIQEQKEKASRSYVNYCK
eukprot:192384_1